MIVFAEQISNRLKYSLDYVLVERLGLTYSICSDFEVFLASALPKINYSTNDSNGIQITPVALLFEKGITAEKPKIIQKEGKSYLYPAKGALGFDVFAACFWLLSRYEEYQKYKPDAHNRFPATESLAFKHGFLNQPIIDYWIVELKKQIQTTYPKIQLKQEQYEVIPTIDVDSPWCYKNKGLIRNVGGSIRDVLKKNWHDVLFRWLVMLGFKNDPHYIFPELKKFYQQHQLNPIYFLHVGNFGTYDKTIAYYKRAFKLFLAHATYNNSWGIHPSYAAAESNYDFKRELKRLEKVSGQKVLLSRHHYLKINLPHSYQFMISQGIEHDYTMGFADKSGFRAGTSRPFKFFDLTKNESTSLMVHPFVLMDRTLNSYEQFSADEVLQNVKDFVACIKEVNGCFVSLWHNESLSDFHEWKGWKTLYENMLKIALNK